MADRFNVTILVFDSSLIKARVVKYVMKFDKTIEIHF